uniref:Uncharacterized protein n=1 Tax=Glossina pallidipes TaxID=7398 RepID=A0A1B0A7X2_GLOPL
MESYKKWSFDNIFPCDISKMAEISRYPWREYARYAPQCHFVKCGRKEKDLLVSLSRSFKFLILFHFNISVGRISCYICFLVVKNKLHQNIDNLREQFDRQTKNEINSLRAPSQLLSSIKSDDFHALLCDLTVLN